jgi:hypothetical protein
MGSPHFENKNTKKILKNAIIWHEVILYVVVARKNIQFGTIFS